MNTRCSHALLSLTICVRTTRRPPTEREIFGTLCTLAEKSGWPIPDTLVATVVAAALQENDGREISAAQVEAARAKMKPRQTTLEIKYELEKKTDGHDKAFSWIRFEGVRSAEGRVSLKQVRAVAKAVAESVDSTGDVNVSTSLVAQLLNFPLADGTAAGNLRDLPPCTFHALSGLNTREQRYASQLAAVRSANKDVQKHWVEAQLRLMCEAGAMLWPGSAGQVEGFRNPPRFRACEVAPAASITPAASGRDNKRRSRAASAGAASWAPPATVARKTRPEKT